MNAKDDLAAWLRDAHTMKRAMETVLRRQAEDEDLVPEWRRMANRHLQETRQHADTLLDCLETLGIDTSLLSRDAEPADAERLGDAGGYFAGNNRLRGLLAAKAAEHLEIGYYQALREGALWIKENEIAAACENILVDDQAMADWLDENAPKISLTYLTQNSATLTDLPLPPTS